jgi:tRNA A37 N6-isopentenylltransferase MiaA
MKNKKNLTLLIAVAFLLFSIDSLNAQEFSTEEYHSKNKFSITEYSEKGEIVLQIGGSGSHSSYSSKLNNVEKNNKKEKLKEVNYVFKKKRLSFILKKIGYKEYVNKLAKDPIVDIEYSTQTNTKEEANKIILDSLLENFYLKKE